MAADQTSDGQRIERRYKLGDVLIREICIHGRWTRAWITWRAESYLDRAPKLAQYYGKAIKYPNVLVMKPWHGIKKDDRLFSDIKTCEAYIASLPDWEQTEYCCFQHYAADRGKIYRCSDGEEMDHEVIERDFGRNQGADSSGQ